jgi:hypothetical protein
MINNKGIAIFISLMLLFLLSAAVIAVLLTAYNYNSICEGQIKRIKAINSAEAGVNYTYYQLRTDAATFVNDHNSELTADTIVPGSNGISVKVWATGPVSGRYTVSSKAEYQKVSAP